MGEFIASGSTDIPAQLLSSIVCTLAIAIYALVQPSGNSDDDDSSNGGGGGGGLMQPVTSSAGAA